MAELVVDKLRKEYPTPGAPLVVLSDVSLTLDRGESLAIVGPSGSGKSTLLYVLGTLERPTAGRVTYGGSDPFALPPAELAAFRNRRLGFVFQDHHLLPQLSVWENVLLPGLAQGRVTPAQAARARELLARVGLAERLTHRPAELSGGERQRAALARALLLEPMVVLADEPTGNLDRTTAGQVAELLLELVAQERAILIVVTHSLELAGRLERVVELDQGRLEPGRRASLSAGSEGAVAGGADRAPEPRGHVVD